MQNSIYILSGLGTDERVFKNLVFEGHSINFIKWVEPGNNEPMSAYALKLIEQVVDEMPILIGLSFGGMMAVEIAKHIKTKKVILISSAKTYREIPFYFRFFGSFGVHKILPFRFLMEIDFFTNWLFGVYSKPDKLLLRLILDDIDHKFLLWSIDEILKWKNVQIPQNLVHIHGSHDKILPIRFVKYHLRISRGCHLMILNQPEDLNAILKDLLEERY